MKVKLLTSTATLPTRATPGASCFDLYADCEPTIIQPGGRALIPTNIAVELPLGTELQVRPRSGLALNFGVVAHFGTVDSDYRGAVGVILFNHSTSEFAVSRGMRIAQGAVVALWPCVPQLVTELSETTRGAGGFGSTGG
jgi:dUTP pyrophosphatase